MHNHQALRVTVACPDEVDAFLVLGSREAAGRIVAWVAL